MINYLALPVIVLLTALMTHVITQGPHLTTNRLFGGYLALGLASNINGFILLTTTDERLALASVALVAPLVALDLLLLVWLVLALFLPARYEQPAVRWAISAPYLLGVALVTGSSLIGVGAWYGGVEHAPGGTFSALVRPGFSPMLGYYLAGSYAAMGLLLGIVVRVPRHRRPAGALLLGMVLSQALSISPVVRDLPIFYQLGPLPLYLAFGWIVQRYQLFRPTTALFQAAVERLADGVLVLDAQRHVRYANPAARRQLGGAPLDEAPLDALLEQASLVAADGGESGDRARFVRAQEPELVLDVSETEVPNSGGSASMLLLRDVTLAERQTAALSARNEEQRRLLELVEALETPVLELLEGVLVAPLVGRFDARRGERLTAELLRAVGERRARVMILDLAGAPAVDATMAARLVRTGQALQLLGCRTVLTGISSAAALTFTQLGVELGDMQVARSPQEALRAEAAGLAAGAE